MEPNTNTTESVIADTEMKMPADAVMPAVSTEKEESSMPVLLGVIIVLLVLILGGLYLWSTTFTVSPVDDGAGAMRPTPAENNEPESATADAQVEALETVSTSNSMDAIEADIESTNFADIDAELGTIDAEIDAAMQ